MNLSNALSLTTPKVLGSVALPDAPVATAASSITTTGLTANWNPATGATSYRLDVSTVSNFASFVAGFEDLTVAGTSQAVTGLSAGTNYFYRVRAVNAGGASGNSNTINPITVPSAPASQAASSITSSSFTANWSAATGAASYRLDVSTVSNFASFVTGYQDLTVGGTSQAVTGLTGSTPYFYRVRAVNAGGTSANSSTQNPTTSSSLVTGLTHYWKMDAAPVNDEVGTDDLVAVTGAAIDATGKINSCGLLTGGTFSDGGPNPNTLCSFALATKTISFWMRADSLDGGMVMGHADGNDDSVTQWKVSAAETQLLLEFIDAGVNPQSRVILNGPATGTWYHIVIGYNLSTGFLKIWLNASLIVNENIGTGGGSDGFNTSDTGFLIGNDAGEFFPYGGRVDEIGIWNRVLSDAEVTALYNSGNALAHPF